MKIEKKLELIDALKGNIKSDLLKSRKDLEEQTKAIDIDEEDVIESEDLSHQSEAKDLQMVIQERIKLKENSLNSLEREEFSSVHESVDFGSIFMSDDVLYIVGVDHLRFSLDNQEIMPISINSPFFKQVRGLHKGDVVDFNGKKVKIEAIA